MADLSKCDAIYAEGLTCPFKYSCKRFTAPAAPHVQAFLTSAPYNRVTHSCKEFLANAPVKLRSALSGEPTP